MQGGRNCHNSSSEIDLSDTSYTLMSDESMRRNASEMDDDPNKLSSIMMEAFQIYLRHNLTLEALKDIFQLLQNFPNNKFQFPLTVYKIMNMFPSDIPVKNFIFCPACAEFVETTEHRVICLKCHTKLRTEESNYFQYFEVKYQIERQFKKHCNEIKGHLESKDDGDKDTIYDGPTISLNKLKSELYCSLSLNTDGASKYKSNAKSLWPLILVQNYLPPNIRYKRENVILAGLHYGDKPNMYEYTFPLVSEMCALQDNPIKFYIENDCLYVIPHITAICCDLPAKSEIQQITQYNGYFACTICLHPGCAIKIETNQRTIIRYTETNTKHNKRNHSDTLEKMRKIYKNPALNVYLNSGVKGCSFAALLPKFDLVNGFAIDYLHCVLLGDMGSMLDNFLNSINKNKPFYINVKNKKILEKRILGTKMNREFSRVPRKLCEYKNYKGNELRTLLLFILPVCLDGILDKKYVRNLQLFSSCIYKLLGTKISVNDLNQTEVELNYFVEQYQVLYGANKMVMNIHLVKHLVESVRHLGPLWAQSLFVYEDFNGYLLKLVNGTTNVLSQIASKYGLQRKYNQQQSHSLSEENNFKLKLLGRGIVMDVNSLSHNEKETILKVVEPNEFAFKHLRYTRGGHTIFTSIEYERAKKTIDYFVGCKDGTIGIAKYYLNIDGIYYCFMNSFEIVSSIHQFDQVAATGNCILIPVQQITEKYVYVSLNWKHFIVGRPKYVEKD